MTDLRERYESWVITNTLKSCEKKGMSWVTEDSIRTSILMRAAERPEEYEINDIQAGYVGFLAGYRLRDAE
ncbi:hypothetical protein D869_gp041 [Caulobacter phage CcrRogue]|uniref:Uncharacterized protein n=1 Tax=Caulobacter phage CcrRogue TaxID=2927986 RepID=K4JS17_9CAUD|nr:hypothetical protein D869_gp041 [Caulobacter phage CcrRogue]AFU86523.1 hypothetical protein CcrRogue_gp041 [Caulobacter phage CcrRogue]